MVVVRSILLASLCAACGASPTAAGPTAVAPATPAGPAGAALTLADLGWLVGGWHAANVDIRWQLVETTLWGVALSDGGYEVDIIDDSDDSGKPTPVALISLDGTTEDDFALRAAAAGQIEAADAHGQIVRLHRAADGLHGEFAVAGQPAVTFTAAPGPVTPAPTAEDADRQFAADSARDGAAAWAHWFAADGEMWNLPPIRGTDAIRAARAKSPIQFTLGWAPVASGARGDLAFTVGRWTVRGTADHGSYCTVWRHTSDGWRAVFDTGRVANASIN